MEDRKKYGSLPEKDQFLLSRTKLKYAGAFIRGNAIITTRTLI